ncbi:hypothetical protein QT595_22565 [Xanthomonas citri pv. citri]
MARKFNSHDALRQVTMWPGANITAQTRTIMDFALENVCRELPNSGGDHTIRKAVARRLMQATQEGVVSLPELEEVGRKELAILTNDAGFEPSSPRQRA